MAEPKIYTKNYVSADDVFTVSSGASSISNAYDGDKDSQYASAGANSDATEVDIEVTFYEGSVPISRTIDTLILLNHNLKNFTVYYWDGAAYQTWLTVTNEAVTSSLKSLSSQTISKIKIAATATQTANQEKKIGELVLCALQVDIGRDFTDYEVLYYENAQPIRFGNGGFVKQIKRFSANRYEKYEARVVLDFISQSVFDSLFSIKQTGKPFLWYPESAQRPDQLYLVNFTESWRHRYCSEYKAAGYRLEFGVSEA